jgi:hypothetical protein
MTRRLSRQVTYQHSIVEEMIVLKDEKRRVKK